MPVTTPAYARLAAVFPDLRVTEGEPRSDAGWTSARQLAAGGPALDAFTRWDTEQIAEEYGRLPRPDVAASLALHRYAWPACLLFTVPWFLHRRVPRLPVADVSCHRESGRMTVRTRSFACLPGDPAASLPGARVLPTQDRIRPNQAPRVCRLIDHATISLNSAVLVREFEQRPLGGTLVP